MVRKGQPIFAGGTNTGFGLLLLTGGPKPGPQCNRLLFTGCGRGLVWAATFRPVVGWRLDRPAPPTVLCGETGRGEAADGRGMLLATGRRVDRFVLAGDGWVCEPVGETTCHGAESLDGVVAGPGGAVVVGVYCRRPEPAIYARYWERLGPGGWAVELSRQWAHWSVVPRDADHFVTDEAEIVRRGCPGGLSVRRWADGAEVARYPSTVVVDHRLVALPDGRVVGTRAGGLRVWDTTGTPSRVPVGRTAVRDIAAHPDGRLLAAATAEQVVLLRTDPWEVIAEVRPGVGRLTAVAFSPDGLLLAAAGQKGQVAVWDV